jgi:hypothetical protein
MTTPTCHSYRFLFSDQTVFFSNLGPQVNGEAVMDYEGWKHIHGLVPGTAEAEERGHGGSVLQESKKEPQEVSTACRSNKSTVIKVSSILCV